MKITLKDILEISILHGFKGGSVNIPDESNRKECRYIYGNYQIIQKILGHNYIAEREKPQVGAKWGLEQATIIKNPLATTEETTYKSLKIEDLKMARTFFEEILSKIKRLRVYLEEEHIRATKDLNESDIQTAVLLKAKFENDDLIMEILEHYFRYREFNRAFYRVDCLITAIQACIEENLESMLLYIDKNIGRIKEEEEQQEIEEEKAHLKDQILSVFQGAKQ